MEKIRKANKEDIMAIYALLQEGVSGGKVLQRSIKELKQVIKYFYICEIENKVVGCCSLEIYSQKLAEIRSLVVSSEHRNKRVGSKLIQKCLDEAKKKDIYQVLSVTDKSDLFERFGFRTEVNEKQIMFLNFNSRGGISI